MKMHYEINFTGTEAEKDAQAIKEIINWLGQEKFNDINEEFRAFGQPVTLGRFSLLVSIAGIQGYPVQAWARFLGPSVVTM